MSARNIGYHELLEALGERGCPVCRRAEESVDAAISAILHEHVNDVGFREQLLATGGFCRQDAWRLVRHHDILGTAILHRALLSAESRKRARCVLCGSRQAAARTALEALVALADDEQLLERLSRSDGLCNEHFDAAMRLSPRSSSIARAQGVARSALVAQLDELIRKQDYRFSSEPSGKEADAWLRAVAAVSGLEPAELPRRRSAKLPPAKRDERLP